MKTLLIVAVVVAVAAFVGCCVMRRVAPDEAVQLTARPTGRVAVLYYSQSKVGNTRTVAEWIARLAGGDLIAIETVEPYPDAYGDTLRAVQAEMDSGKPRALKPVPPLDGYDTVFLGSPIWYGTYALPVGEFLKANRLDGKTVAPFCTHGGGGAGRFFADVRAACPGANVTEGLSLRGSNQIERRIGRGVLSHHAETDARRWLNKIFTAN